MYKTVCKELKNVYKIIRSSKRFTRFLIAFFVFSFSLQTVLYIASYFGVNEIDWTGSDQTSGLIISILLIQIVAMYKTVCKENEKTKNLEMLLY